MANYYRVSPKFWLWARRRSLTDAETSLAFYLLTCEHRNLEGLYRLPLPYVAADLGWPAEKVSETLASVIVTGFAAHDADAEMILIPKALKHQAPTTDKQIIGAVSQLERIPRTCLWSAFRMACRSHCPKLADALDSRWPAGSDAIRMPFECDSNTRAGSSSSSNSTSSSSSHSPRAPAPVGVGVESELAKTISEVMPVLGQCNRLHIDQVGVENSIAAWPGRDPVRAARTVVSWVTDPAFRQTNAAKLLGDALSKQQQQRPGAETPVSVSDFSKYDRAAQNKRTDRTEAA